MNAKHFTMDKHTLYTLSEVIWRYADEIEKCNVALFDLLENGEKITIDMLNVIMHAYVQRNEPRRAINMFQKRKSYSVVYSYY